MTRRADRVPDRAAAAHLGGAQPPHREAVLASSRPLGAIEPMTRQDLRWLITIPGDGRWSTAA